MTQEEQKGAALILVYLTDSVTYSPKLSFTKDEVLALFNLVGNDSDWFDTSIYDTMLGQLSEQADADA